MLGCLRVLIPHSALHCWHTSSLHGHSNGRLPHTAPAADASHPAEIARSAVIGYFLFCCCCCCLLPVLLLLLQMAELQEKLGLDTAALLEEYQETQQVLMPVVMVSHGMTAWRHPRLASNATAAMGLPEHSSNAAWPPASLARLVCMQAVAAAHML